MSLQAPAWLTAEFLQKVLKKSENDVSIQVTQVAMKRATMTGDNYLSDMIRASVEYSRNNSGHTVAEKKSLIIKIAPTTEGHSKEMVAELGAFNTEIKMMETTLVKMHELLNEKGYRLSARVLYTEIGDPSLLVIEDLAPLGYRMADRQAGLDLEHCILAIRGLAKFHASSVALCEKDPKIMETYGKGLFHDDNPKYIKKMCEDRMRILANEVLNWSELGSSAQSYSTKLLKLSEVCYEKLIEACKSKDDEFNVLNHGDVWVNNMLFRYNKDGMVIDHTFVDFQFSMWGSPAIDILRLTSVSTSEDVELHHYTTLLQEYLKILTETMSRLRCKTQPPSMTILKKTLKDHEILAIIWSAIGLPFVLIDKNEVMTIDQILQQDDDYVNPVYKGLAYRKIILRRLSAWNANGLLDL